MLIVRYTKHSIKDLEEIRKYICNDNYHASKKVITHIVLTISNLKFTPNLGRMGRVLRTRELVVPKYPYIVSYRVTDNEIIIYRILHTSKKWEY